MLTNHVYVMVNEKTTKVFRAVYSILGLNGKPKLSVFRYTQYSSELTEIIPVWSEVRIMLSKNISYVWRVTMQLGIVLNSYLPIHLSLRV